MNSPEFRYRQKKTGFISKKSQQSSEEEIYSSKNRYFQTLNKYQNPYDLYQREKYRQKLWQHELIRARGQRHDIKFHNNEKGCKQSIQSESSSSSDFDKFQLNSNNTQSQYDFTRRNKNQINKHNIIAREPIESSFELSPYRNSTSQNLQSQQNLQEMDSKSNENSKQLKYRRSTIKQQSQQEQYSSLDLKKQKRKNKVRNQFKDSYHKYNFLKKQTKQKNRKNIHHQIGKKKQKFRESETSSSGFSLDSDKFKEYGKIKQKNQIKVQPLSKNINKIQAKFGKQIQSSKEFQKSKQIKKSKEIQKSKQLHKNKQIPKQKLSRKDLEEKLSSSPNNSSGQNQQDQYQQQQEEQQQLITEYDTKQFKGGSIKDRILDNFKNRQDKSTLLKKIHINHQSEQKNLYKSRSPEIKKQKEQIRKKNQSKILQQYYSQSPQKSDSHQKALMFEIDVKKKNLTLAQAFQINCTRLKKKLQNQRQQFKKGNRANQNQTLNNQNKENDKKKINIAYRFQHKSQGKQQQSMNNTRKPQNNQKVQRLAMGIKAPITKKQMYTMTLRNYKQLPQVKNKVNAQKKKQDLFRRMQNVKKLDREVRLRLRYGR